MSPKRYSARRSWHQLFGSSERADPFPSPTSTTLPRIPPEDEIPLPQPPSLSMIPQSQLPSNSTNLQHSPFNNKSQLAHQTSGEEMEEDKPSQQPGIKNGSSSNEEQVSGSSTDEEEEEESSFSPNDGVHKEEEEEEPLAADISGSHGTDVVAVEENNSPCRRRAKWKGGKPGAYVRVWSLRDEVGILEGLVAHVETHGSPPGRSELCDVLHGRILDRKEFTVTEIYEKVRRLRDKYHSMRVAAVSGAPLRGGVEDRRKYEISHKIWGDSSPLPNGGKKKGNPYHAQGPRVRRDFEEFRHVYPHLALEVENIAGKVPLKRVIELIDDAKASQLNDKVKKQRVLEIKADLDRASLQGELLSMFIKLL
ncbi:hypothetical protein ZWY2020_059995 [Hordeum vulgare]|nr:hypothetical protein ZWY2020_059995 [Hordeum vulgare]